MRCASITRIDTKLLCLFGGLRTGTGDDEHILKAVLVQDFASEFNSKLTLFMREVLGLPIASLNKDACDSALLYSGYMRTGALVIISTVRWHGDRRT
jgi:hypothetical protein